MVQNFVHFQHPNDIHLDYHRRVLPLQADFVVVSVAPLAFVDTFPEGQVIIILLTELSLFYQPWTLSSISLTR